MPKRTSFSQEFPSQGTPITLYCIISPDNLKQQGENFLEFVNLINENANNIAHIIIVDGSYLLRNYSLKYGDHRNQKILFEWREAHKQYLEQIRIPYEVISWFQLIGTDQYKEIHTKIIKAFDEGTDTELVRIINELAARFSRKGTFKQCIQYLLEECAAALIINEYLTYPGELNEAIQYVMKKYNMGPKFIQYNLKNKRHHTELPQPQLLCPFFTLPRNNGMPYRSPFAMTVDDLFSVLRSDETIDPQQKLWFMQQILVLCSKVMSSAESVPKISVSTQVEGEDKNDKEEIAKKSMGSNQTKTEIKYLSASPFS